jgi:transcriptional regulator with XRE-family HTH domain
MQGESQRQLLGAFVRARREALQPDERGRRRRTPGLRREELAARAGIGVTWIAWIEQGREVSVSAHSLSRLSDALHLTRAERAYLFELGGRHDPQNIFTADDGHAPASILALVQSLACPAYGLDPAWNICGWNAPARDLFVGLAEAEHRNLLRYVFTHPAARDLIPDWEDRAARLLAEFRADYGRHLTDPRCRAVIDWLVADSAFFRDAWERQAVAGREGGERLFIHPTQGHLRFQQHTLHAAERPDFKLVTLHPQSKTSTLPRE